MSENRVSQRLNIELPVSYRSVCFPGKAFSGNTLNVSASGLCLKIGTKFDIGEELSIKVTLPSREKLTVSIKVIWVQQVFAGDGADIKSDAVEYKIGVQITEPLRIGELKFVRFYAGALRFFSSQNQQNQPA